MKKLTDILAKYWQDIIICLIAAPVILMAAIMVGLTFYGFSLSLYIKVTGNNYVIVPEN